MQCSYKRSLWRTETDDVTVSELCHKRVTEIMNNSLLTSTWTSRDNNETT